MIDLVAFAEPTPLWKSILAMAAVMFGMLVLLAGGSYLFIRILAGFVVKRDKVWESTGGVLGLSIDPKSVGMLKPLIGNRDGFAVRLEHYSIPRGETSSDPCASVDVTLAKPFAFTFEINKNEWLHQKVAEYFSEGETGIDYLDDAFKVTSSSMPDLLELLNVSIPDRESSNLTNTLMQANKAYHRVKVTDRSVTLGMKAEFGETVKIEQLMERAVYIATRVQTAQAKVEDGSFAA